MFRATCLLANNKNKKKEYEEGTEEEVSNFLYNTLIYYVSHKFGSYANSAVNTFNLPEPVSVHPSESYDRCSRANFESFLAQCTSMPAMERLQNKN